jgi:hypothetical protein
MVSALVMTSNSRAKNCIVVDFICLPLSRIDSAVAIWEVSSSEARILGTPKPLSCEPSIQIRYERPDFQHLKCLDSQRGAFRTVGVLHMSSSEPCEGSIDDV